MPKTVSSSEAKARFGELMKWAATTQDSVIVKLYGEPTAVMMSYTEYQELEQLRKREQKRRVLEALDRVRAETRAQNPALTDEEVYQLAGFSAEVIAETIQMDQELAAQQP